MNKEKNGKKEENKGIEEDNTKYGEFISSYFMWLSPKEQKERAKKLQNMTKK
jgi:formiminotetrahydrofolate cyclodeaminase